METRINKHLYTWLGVFILGCFGVHRFMRKQVFLGILMLITLGLLGVWQLIDWIIALVKYGQYNDDFIFVDGQWQK